MLALALGGRAVLERLRAAGAGARVQRGSGCDIPPGSDGAQARRQLDQRARPGHPSVASRSDPLVQSSGRWQKPLAPCARRRASPRPPPPRRPPRRPPPHRSCRPSAPRPSSPAPSNGSTPRATPAHARRAARPRRAGRLLDLHVHQLPAHAPLPQGLGRPLPPVRADDRRRPYAGVLLRAGRRNVAGAIESLGIEVPGCPGQQHVDLECLGNQYWPAEYLVDAAGHVRSAQFGEGDYADDRGRHPGAAGRGRSTHRRRRPAGRREHAVPSRRHPGDLPRLGPGPGLDAGNRAGRRRRRSHRPARPEQLQLRRTVDDQRRDRPSSGRRRAIDGRVQAENVYLVLSPPSGGGIRPRRRARSTANPAPTAGDVRNGTVAVTAQRLYRLAAFPSDGRHRLTLIFSPGTRGFSFTFG